MNVQAFDYDLFVIGAGSGGLAAAERAAVYGARVAIAEEANIGGACVNYGCIPEKFLDFAASFYELDRVALSYGWNGSNSVSNKRCDRHFDWSMFINAKNAYIQQLNGLHWKHLQEAGVKIFQGRATFLDTHTLSVGDRAVTADKILIAVGAKPSKLEIPGIEHTINWRELYQLPEQPKQLVIYGGDPIGVKIAGSLNELGSQVTLAIVTETILPGLDPEIARTIQEKMSDRGVKFIKNTTIKNIERRGDCFCLTLSENTENLTIDTILIDAPRIPNLAELSLNRVGIQLTKSGTIPVDEYSRTSQVNIFAVGDSTDRIPLTPSAIAQARAFADTEFGNHPQKVNFDWVPMSISAHPEAATVGLSETQAIEKFGEAVYCYRTQFRPLLYCLGKQNERMFIKVVVNRQDAERILGIHIVGDSAVEMVQCLAVALKLGATKQDLDNAIGIHPSSGEELFSL